MYHQTRHAEDTDQDARACTQLTFLSLSATQRAYDTWKHYVNEDDEQKEIHCYVRCVMTNS